MSYDENYMGYTPGNNLKYEILPEGMYDFVIHGIVGLGLREKIYEGKQQDPVPTIKIIFEIPEFNREDGQTELLTIKFPISSGKRSNYYKFCTTLLGAAVTDVETNMNKLCTAAGMKGLLGKVGTLTVAAWKNGEGRSVLNNGFSPLHPKVAKPVSTREPVFFNPFNPDITVFKNKLTQWTRKEIMSAVNANEFSPELHKAYEEATADYEANKNKGDNEITEDKDVAPWEGSTEAIQ